MTKHYLFILIAALTICFTACKKDQLAVKDAQSYVQLNYTPSGPLDGGWGLTLQPNGVADILPGGDIVYRVTT